MVTVWKIEQIKYLVVAVVDLSDGQFVQNITLPQNPLSVKLTNTTKTGTVPLIADTGAGNMRHQFDMRVFWQHE